MRKERSVCLEGQIFLQGMRFLMVLVLAFGCSACATSSNKSEKTRMNIEKEEDRGTIHPKEKVLLDAPPLDDNALLEAPHLDDNAILEAPPLDDFVVSVDSPSESPIVLYEYPISEESLVKAESKKNLGKTISSIKKFTRKRFKSTAIARIPSNVDNLGKETMKKAEMVEVTLPVVKNLNKRFTPVKLFEEPHHPAQKVEIASHAMPKPETEVKMFLPDTEFDTSGSESYVPSQTTNKSSMKPEDLPQLFKTLHKKVRIVTQKSPLRVRRDPNLNSKILTKLPKGSLVPFITEKTGWFMVEFSTGKMGWISQKYSQIEE